MRFLNPFRFFNVRFLGSYPNFLLTVKPMAYETAQELHRRVPISNAFYWQNAPLVPYFHALIFIFILSAFCCILFLPIKKLDPECFSLQLFYFAFSFYLLRETHACK
jgi:hypothetical protein